VGTGGDGVALREQVAIPSISAPPLPPLAEVLAPEPAREPDLGGDRPVQPADRSPDRGSARRWWLLLLLVVVLGLGVRVACTLTDDVPTTDATAYLRSGESLWAGQGFERDGAPELHFPPGAPALLGGAERLLGDPVVATSVVFLLFGTALLVPLAGIARHLGGDRTGLMAAGLGAVAPALTILPVQQGGGSEAPFTLFVLSATWLALVLPRWSSRAQVAGAAGLGGLVGLAYLTRPEGLLLALVLVPVLLVMARRSSLPSGAAPRRAAVLLGTFALVLAVLAAPYVVHLHAHTGRWELTAKAQDASMQAWRDVAERDRRGRDEIFYALDDTGLALEADRSTLSRLVRDDPAGYATIVGINARALVTELGLRWSVVPVAIILLAAFGAWSTRRSKGTLVVLAMAVAAVVPALAFFVLPRYLIPTSALLIALAAVGLTRLPRRAQVPATALTGLLLVGALLGGLGAPSHLGAPREPVEHRLVGEWLAEHAEPGDTLMTRNQVTEHYAGLEIVPLPAASMDEVVAFARHYGVDWIVVDEYRLRHLRPQLDPLFEAGPWQGLRLEHELVVEGRRTRVFVLDPQPDPDDVAAPPGDVSFVADQRAG
jgi:hypothetical protein